MVISKNTSEKVMTDTGQYYDVHNMVLYKVVPKMATSIAWNTTARKLYYVRLDSKAAREVHGVEMHEVYDLVRETKVGYYRKDTWGQSKFEDPDYRAVTKMLQYGKSVCGSDFLQYRTQLEDKFVEGYKVRQCQLDYNTTAHGS